MIVVSDTSALGALVTVRQTRLLTLMFGRVIVPPVVVAELSMFVRLRFEESRLEEVLSMLEVKEPTSAKDVELLRAQIDAGEAAAIVLARELRPDFLLIDESRGRQIAEGYGLRIKGVIGVLVDAKRKGHIPAVKPLLDEAIATIQFRIDQPLYQHALRLAGEL